MEGASLERQIVAHSRENGKHVFERRHLFSLFASLCPSSSLFLVDQLPILPVHQSVLLPENCKIKLRALV